MRKWGRYYPGSEGHFQDLRTVSNLFFFNVYSASFDGAWGQWPVAVLVIVYLQGACCRVEFSPAVVLAQKSELAALGQGTG